MTPACSAACGRPVAALREMLLAIPAVTEVRGRGLMLGVGLEEGRDAKDVTARCLEGGLVINAPEQRTLRLLPPLVIDRSDAERAAEIIAAALG